MIGSCLAALAVCTSVAVAGMAAPALGQANARASTTPDTLVRFDIPAQPLTAALDAYAAAAGLEVFYDSNLTAARRSTAVKGLLAPDVALRVLLEGTGLTAMHAVNAFAVAPLDMNGQGSGTSLARHIPYLALVQGAIERGFCREPETAPGHYRVVLRFGIGTAGDVRHPQLLGTTGDLRRDGLIIDLLRGLSIEQAPPTAMPQPVTMIVSPRSPAQTGDCGSADGGPGARAHQRAAQ